MKLHKSWMELHKKYLQQRHSAHARALVCWMPCPVTYIAAPEPRITHQLHLLLVLVALSCSPNICCALIRAVAELAPSHRLI